MIDDVPFFAKDRDHGSILPYSSLRSPET
jgi:hypothetical protein